MFKIIIFIQNLYYIIIAMNSDSVYNNATKYFSFIIFTYVTIYEYIDDRLI